MSGFLGWATDVQDSPAWMVPVGLLILVVLAVLVRPRGGR